MDFPANAHRINPYANFKFRLKYQEEYVAGISKCSALSRSTEVIEHRRGGDPSTVLKSPGQTSYEAVTFEQGVTHNLWFHTWANKVWNVENGLGEEVSLADFRRNLTVELLNEAGQVAIAYHLFRCWVSEYQALPELDASANAVAIQTLKVEHEGWVRDHAVTEPTEPTIG